MAKRIALFNHKGGVSKTTTTFHLGWMLAEKGHKVMLVDADPQCNLSGLILGFHGEGEFEKFYEHDTARNIKAGLTPAFESHPTLIAPVDCVEVRGRSGLFLLPGHIRLSEYEVTLGIAQQLSDSLQTLQNLPGSIDYLLDVTADKYGIDFILVDMNPSLSSINQNLLMTSDFFILPTAPDYFSVMAIDSLTSVLPRWHQWAERAKKSGLATASYPFPNRTPKFLGSIIQKYRPRRGKASEGFQTWIDAINTKVTKQFVPMLEKNGMILNKAKYEEVPNLLPNYCLSQIADFNSLISKSQKHKTPVYSLTDEQLGHVGTVLARDRRKQEDFRGKFSTMADSIVTLSA